MLPRATDGRGCGNAPCGARACFAESCCSAVQSSTPTFYPGSTTENCSMVSILPLFLRVRWCPLAVFCVTMCIFHILCFFRLCVEPSSGVLAKATVHIFSLCWESIQSWDVVLLVKCPVGQLVHTTHCVPRRHL